MKASPAGYFLSVGVKIKKGAKFVTLSSLNLASPTRFELVSPA
jgi:hypothetical protein